MLRIRLRPTIDRLWSPGTCRTAAWRHSSFSTPPVGERRTLGFGPVIAAVIIHKGPNQPLRVEPIAQDNPSSSDGIHELVQEAEIDFVAFAVAGGGLWFGEAGEPVGGVHR